MKTILSVVLLTMFGTTATFAQSSENIPNPILCSAAKSGDVITYSDLMNCDELTLPYKELKVKSFVFAFKAQDGLFVEYQNVGGKLNQDVKDAIKTLESTEVRKVMIESVVVIQEDGTERKMRGLDVVLKQKL